MPSPEPRAGRVVQISRKPETPGEHGLPKVPTPRASVRFEGVEGDFNRYRHEKKRDAPDQALLLYSTDLVARLNAEGWPIRAGDLGENLLIDGIDYDAMQPGTEWRIGADLLVRVSEPCHPCKNLAALAYVGRERMRDFLATMKGRRGWYAKVLQEGEVRAGDEVRPA